MNRFRRQALAATLAVSLAAAFAAPTAFAQAYPNKPVKLIVNFPPGGAADVLGRALAQQLGEQIKQQVVVENRPGANGNIGADAVAKSPADGYTLLMSSGGSMTVNPFLYAKMPFDAEKDLVPVASVARVLVYLVVHPSVPVNTLAEFVNYARANPGKLSFGTPGNGSSPHLATEMFKRQARFDATHVPYRGAAPALTDLLAGQVQFTFDPGPGLRHAGPQDRFAQAVGQGARFASAARVGQPLQLRQCVVEMFVRRLRGLVPAGAVAGRGQPAGARRAMAARAGGARIAHAARGAGVRAEARAGGIVRPRRHGADVEQAAAALFHAGLEAPRRLAVALARQGPGQHLLAAQGFVVVAAVQALVQVHHVLLQAPRFLQLALLRQRRGQAQQDAQGVGMLGAEPALARRGERLLHLAHRSQVALGGEDLGQRLARLQGGGGVRPGLALAHPHHAFLQLARIAEVAHVAQQRCQLLGTAQRVLVLGAEDALAPFQHALVDHARARIFSLARQGARLPGQGVEGGDVARAVEPLAGLDHGCVQRQRAREFLDLGQGGGQA